MKKYISVLMYHRVGEFKRIKEHRALYCKKNQFALQMWFLKFFKYKVISLDEALFLMSSSNHDISSKHIVLTFDDGYLDFYEFAYPILRKYNFHATVYVLSHLIGKNAVWFLKEGREAPLLLNKDQLLQLIKTSHIEIGSHGRFHLKLSEIPVELAKEEIENSKYRLEKELGIKIKHFCYPYGKFNKKVVELVRDAGYSSAVTCVRAGVDKDTDPYLIPRKAISFGDSLIGFLWKIHIKNKPKQKVLC